LTTLRPRVAGVCDRCGGDLYLREDDNPESIRERILAYENGILPLLDFYQKQKLLLTVESTTPEETRLITLSALKAHTSS
jgi:adenylate kinase